MATVLLNRSDTFPVGTSVGVYPYGASARDGQPPHAAAIASATVASDGSLTVTDSGIASLTRYVAGASVGGVWRYLYCRSTLDREDKGVAVGTLDTANGSTALANVSASSGAFAVGQFITGAGIPPQTWLVSGSGGSWVMSAKATADGTTVAVAAYGARVPVGVVPQRPDTTWQAQLRQRRQLAGTS